MDLAVVFAKTLPRSPGANRPETREGTGRFVKRRAVTLAGRLIFQQWTYAFGAPWADYWLPTNTRKPGSKKLKAAS
jgi:hypothetical protein